MNIPIGIFKRSRCSCKQVYWNSHWTNEGDNKFLKSVAQWLVVMFHGISHLVFFENVYRIWRIHACKGF